MVSPIRLTDTVSNNNKLQPPTMDKMMETSTIPVLDLSSSKFIDNPYPTYHQLIENSPVTKVEIFGGAWLISDYQNVKKVLKSKQFTNNTLHFLFASFTETEQVKLREFYDFHKSWLPYLRDEVHQEARGILHKALDIAMNSFQDLFIKKAGLMADSLRAKKNLEFMAEYACPFPAFVMCYMIGAEEESTETLIRCVDIYHELIMSDAPTFEKALAASEAVFVIKQTFEKLLSQPEKVRKNSVLDTLNKVELTHCSRELILGQITILLIGGYANTHNVLGNGLVALLKHPGAMKALHDDPNLIPTAVRELIRFDTSSQLTPRLAVEDVVVGGELIKKDELVFLLMGAANRDPSVFENPDELVLTRKKNPHITFGAGEHVCIGLHLTLKIAEWAFTAITQCLPELKLHKEKLQRIQSIIFRGYKKIVISSID